MLPLRIHDATRVLAEDQDDFTALAIRDENVGGFNQMTSLWEPSPAERAALAAGGAVRLTILGSVHPPVMLAVQPPPSEEPT
ncbi:hypothetical protein [Albimonas pacifica]|uniref:Uncharacterized protein n=1 Tax=Albimonas pacifica TaxID=1114924 RepID=A0A1I3JI65_9RHOB|nr:hypothetical protein [Albimonas pacifica]SFI59810.1 hypothetical protein SAMN05216258_10814 [Albimonas pacifica]